MLVCKSFGRNNTPIFICLHSFWYYIWNDYQILHRFAKFKEKYSKTHKGAKYYGMYTCFY